jgi:NAD(P)H-dependent flavin oxidoreductase YrpB (nitropropane dioxygenase family)
MTLPWTVPVMQAPVGPAATPELAAAVSEAGGIGSLGASWTEPGLLREQIRAIRRRTDRPFLVNLVLDFDQEERLELVCDEAVPIVSFSWGVDARLVERAHAAGCLVLAQAGSAAEGRAAVAAGADALIAQGVEAGGHVQGDTPLLELVGQLRGGVPVVAAGGIAHADGLRRALAAGAAGVVIGTRFLATPEADIHPGYAERLLAAGPDDTVLTHLFDGGWPGAAHRVLRNSTYRAWEEAGSPGPGARPREGEIVAESDGVPIARYAADEPRRSTTGEIEAMCLYAGRGVGRITSVEPAAEIVARMVS